MSALDTHSLGLQHSQHIVEDPSKVAQVVVLEFWSVAQLDTM